MVEVDTTIMANNMLKNADDIFPNTTPHLLHMTPIYDLVILAIELDYSFAALS
jgi:hypothetical protein